MSYFIFDLSSRGTEINTFKVKKSKLISLQMQLNVIVLQNFVWVLNLEQFELILYLCYIFKLFSNNQVSLNFA